MISMKNADEGIFSGGGIGSPAYRADNGIYIKDYKVRLISPRALHLSSATKLFLKSRSSAVQAQGPWRENSLASAITDRREKYWCGGPNIRVLGTFLTGQWEWIDPARVAFFSWWRSLPTTWMCVSEICVNMIVLLICRPLWINSNAIGGISVDGISTEESAFFEEVPRLGNQPKIDRKRYTMRRVRFFGCMRFVPVYLFHIPDGEEDREERGSVADRRILGKVAWIVFPLPVRYIRHRVEPFVTYCSRTKSYDPVCAASYGWTTSKIQLTTRDTATSKLRDWTCLRVSRTPIDLARRCGNWRPFACRSSADNLAPRKHRNPACGCSLETRWKRRWRLPLAVGSSPRTTDLSLICWAW